MHIYADRRRSRQTAEWQEPLDRNGEIADSYLVYDGDVPAASVIIRIGWQAGVDSV